MTICALVSSNSLYLFSCWRYKYVGNIVKGLKSQLMYKSVGVSNIKDRTNYGRGGSRISSQGVAILKKLRRAEGGAKIFGVFRVKNHDYKPKNHIFSNCGGRCENCWGISCEKSRFYAKKSYFFQFQGGPPRWIRPCTVLFIILHKILTQHELITNIS